MVQKNYASNAINTIPEKVNMGKVTFIIFRNLGKDMGNLFYLSLNHCSCCKSRGGQPKLALWAIMEKIAKYVE